jgi:AraC-like DNA-binding protein
MLANGFPDRQTIAEPAPSEEISVRIYRPATALQSYVTFYYFVESAVPLTDFLYPEWGNVRFGITGEWLVRLPGETNTEPQLSVLFGPTDRHGEIVTVTGGKTIGFGLTPLGWHRLICTDASLMANRVTTLDAALGVEGEALRHALIGDVDDAASVAQLEALLLDLLARQPAMDPLIVRTDGALRDRPLDVAAFARAVGVSPRTLHRLCMRGFGFAPKRLLRRQRFLDTLGRVRSAVGDPVAAALDSAYFDQAHFYRDFHDFMAMSPRAYFSAPRRLMAEAASAQRRAGVTLSFLLPPQPGE